MSIFNGLQQAFSRQLSVLRLGTRILHGHADSTWPVPQRYRGGNFVYVLPARTAGARKSFLKIGLTNADPRHAILDLLLHGRSLLYSISDRRDILATMPKHTRHPN